MSLFEVFILAALAVYRLTLMVSSEEGPADIFGRFRSAIGVRYDEHSRPIGKNWFAKGVVCFYCLSVWFGLLATALVVGSEIIGKIEISFMVFMPFALSGVAVFLKKWTG